MTTCCSKPDPPGQAGSHRTARMVWLHRARRLIASTWDPALPATLAQQWRHTATWMAPHAKYVAVFDVAARLPPPRPAGPGAMEPACAQGYEPCSNFTS